MIHHGSPRKQKGRLEGWGGRGGPDTTHGAGLLDEGPREQKAVALAQGAAPVTATRRRQTQPCSHQELTPARNPSVPGPLGRPTALSTHLHHGPVSLGTPSRATPDF